MQVESPERAVEIDPVPPTGDRSAVRPGLSESKRKETTMKTIKLWFRRLRLAFTPWGKGPETVIGGGS